MASSEAIVGRLGAQSSAWWRERFPGTVSEGTLSVAPGRDLAEQLRPTHGGYRWLDEVGIVSLEPDLAGRFRRSSVQLPLRLDPEGYRVGVVPIGMPHGPPSPQMQSALCYPQFEPACRRLG